MITIKISDLFSQILSKTAYTQPAYLPTLKE